MFFEVPPEDLDVTAFTTEPASAESDRSQCLECAFATLLAQSGVEIGEREDARTVIAAGQSVMTTSERFRATIYRCGTLGCDRAMMTVTEVSKPTLPKRQSDIEIYTVPGSADCALPKDS